MTLDPSVFKAYDVRGTHPDQLDERGAYAIGRAFVEHLGAHRVAVGRDMRTMAPAMADALMHGMVDAGAHVLDLGMVGTEMLYFAVASLALDGGIQVTASHNPKHYIGFKVVRRKAQPVGGDSGLDRIATIARGHHELRDAPTGPPAEVEPYDVWPAFVDKVLEFVDLDTIRPLTVVFDAGNGLGGRMFEPLLERLPITAIRCNFQPDGTFPNHEPNPLLEENREFIVQQVVEHGADLGVAWDGDADRCFFVDDAGEFVPGDFITALLARAELRRSPGAKVLYDVRASWAVADTVHEAGGEAISSRVGHAFIKQRMRREDAAFAGEVSGHYYFRDFFSVDTGIVPALMMLQLVSELGGRLSTLVAPFRERYFISGEINSVVEDVPVTLQQLKERYRDGAIDHTDGVSVSFADWHFNVRPSNTEPLLRLNLESLGGLEDMERRRDEVLELIRSGSRERIA